MSDDSGALTIDEFARRIEALISEAREEGLSDEAMIAGPGRSGQGSARSVAAARAGATPT
jgi:hypothetical protein